MQEKEILIFKTSEGKEPFLEWLFALGDKTSRYRIETRIDRLKCGNFGDHKRFKGIVELRLSFGKGYRVYCGEDGARIVILLQGGDKSSQKKDIQKALEYWREYHEKK
jgi:putative addiction module killer protein